MERLLILRHGEAVDAAEVGGRDEPRYLTEKGRLTIARAARGIGALKLGPSRIWSSPYPRALQTAQLVAEQHAPPGGLETLAALEPGASPEGLCALLRERAAEPDMQRLMIVGHNPDLEWLVAHLISTNGDAAVVLKKGALAHLRFAVGPRAGGAELVGLWTVKQLGMLGEANPV